MHPQIRLVTLLVFAALLPWLPDTVRLAIAATLGLMGCLYPAVGRHMWRGVRRTRWLLLSLAILYLWFTPGEPMLPALAAWSPSIDGAEIALQRLALLLAMVLAATALLGGVAAGDIAEALRRLLAGPLRTSPTQRFADRVGLLFATLPDVERQVRESLAAAGSPVERAAALVQAVERDAAGVTMAASTGTLGRVPPVQWLLPLSLLSGGIVVMLSGY